MRKLLEFDFSAVVDGAIKDGAAKIKVAENEWLLPPDHLLLSWSSTENLNGLQASSLLSFLLAEATNKVLSSAPSLDTLKFGVPWAWSHGVRSAQLEVMVTYQGLSGAVKQVSTAQSSRLPPVMNYWFRLLFHVFGSFMLQLQCMWGLVGSVHYQNVWLVTSRMAYVKRADSPSPFSTWVCCHEAGPFPTAMVVPVAVIVVVLLGGKVAPLAIVLSLVDLRGRATSRSPSFDLDL
ncbi:S ribonuclease [Pyrus ussuriensis x Pyrus communis]|uniref:S ribonuclease n=1 Tax=Pyrus ussuriensis x Pyrus communis TaxID=2448454 RepID=A0A5N5GXC9_9ROSA|nr:S ribonuclease [Pyrus ussuriensis x Pyrus communis]